MPNSLRTKLSKLKYKGQITEEEYRELIAKLDGHDEEKYKEGYEQGYADGFADCLEVNT